MTATWAKYMGTQPHTDTHTHTNTYKQTDRQKQIGTNIKNRQTHTKTLRPKAINSKILTIDIPKLWGK